VRAAQGAGDLRRELRRRPRIRRIGRGLLPYEREVRRHVADGRTYRLSDFRGKHAVVLAWFAKAFTAG
jgi:hypothetical protein